tara:strand:+ start:113 stop:337 length:225 start_codon:yes stop_codon:yes gene_type:complete
MVKAFILININSGFEDEIINKLNQINIIKVHPIYGKYDFIITINSSTIDKVKTNIFKIRKMPNVVSTLTMMVIE